MSSALTLSVDVPDALAGVAFFVDGLGFTDPTQLAPGIWQLEYDGVRVFLLEKTADSSPAPQVAPRSYARHWTPVHLDLEVTDLEAAVARAVAAGARVEEQSTDDRWGAIATLSDPFGNGFCLIQPVAVP